MSISCTTPYKAPPQKPEIEISLIPRYGVGRLEKYDTDDQMFWITFNTEHTDFHLKTFYLPQAEYYDYFYYMAPVEFGAATFKFSGLVGGWDGASWPLDDMGDVYGPVQITINGRDWNIWRTDWPGNMEGFYSVEFQNV